MPAVPLLAVIVVVQAYSGPPAQAGKAPSPTATTVVARRAVHAVVIDGKDDDEVWREAPAITAFREFSPREDGPPRFPTEAKVAYDDRNFYAFIRAFDPHPDSILKILARRDVRAPTDQLKIVIDSYHDRRTGFEFAVNPAGVKRDYAIYNDTNEDDAWDGVWEVATTNVSVSAGGGFARSQRLAAGADLKYGLTSNLTVDATVNPDFGQVEADPAVLNLTAFETFFPERRPFFVAGTGTFRFNVNCSQVNCNGERLFYSRRIGRAPQLGGGDPASPIATTIYGAAKLTGRLPGGQTAGVLDAFTQRATGTTDQTTEPATNYAVVRGQQDFRNSERGVGALFTAVNRSLDAVTDASLRRSAYVGAVDFRHRFLGSRYQLSGSFDVSRVSGTPAAITATQ